MPAPTQAEKTERRIERRCRKAISDYQLIEDGDKVLIGLSGGKDSLCLLEMLGKRMMIHKPSFTAMAVHIRMENVSYETDCEYIRQFAAKWNIPLYIETTRFE
ncbi:MAG: tRNA 2-thiocytidine(32) synthetase TtcA, partial [Prevotella sp.]|nr:tRNA 2-thiocytidine(32) synthetase TtcA [Prevotella sp.]